MRTPWVAAAAAASMLLAVSPAAANGRFPASNHVFFSPSDPKLVVLRATFGVLFSPDSGATWRWLCEDVLGLPSTSVEDPTFAMTANGTLFAGTSHGLLLSPNTGCDWRMAGEGLAGQAIVDIAIRPDSPHSLVVLAQPRNGNGGSGDASGQGAQVYASTDDGATWSVRGTAINASVTTSTLDVAATDPHRLYVAGYRVAGATLTPLLLVSTDDGLHWTERSTPPLVNEVNVYIAAVDPTNADRVYIRTEGQSRLFVTSDAGRTFQVPFSSLKGQMLGFALSPDGSKIYAGSREDGLFVAARSSLGSPGAFQNKNSNVRVQCLATRGAELWACADEPSGFIAGVSSDDGATFAAKFQFSDVKAPIACAADAAGAQCVGYLFQQVCGSLGDSGCSSDDGGANGTDAGKTPPIAPKSRSSCGCTGAGEGAPASLFGATVIAALGAGWHRRAKRRRAATRR
jgi:MYXO-CTERM domain-containing protein